MPKRRSPRRKRKTSRARAVTPPTPAQIANQVTFVLKGHLKNVQLAFIRVGILLARVRDEKLWQAIGYADIETYAADRLGMQRTKLYQYLQIHDWLAERHPEWLAPKPKGFIPEMTDVAMLIAIDKRLDGKLASEERTRLEEMRTKALTGKLAKSEFARAKRKPGTARGSLRAFVASFRAIYDRARRTPGIPADVVESLAKLMRVLEQAVRDRATLARVKLLAQTQLAALRGRGIDEIFRV